MVLESTWKYSGGKSGSAQRLILSGITPGAWGTTWEQYGITTGSAACNASILPAALSLQLRNKYFYEPNTNEI